MISGLLIALVLTSADDALNLADLEGYRDALASKIERPAPPVQFRDLWDRPKQFLGRPVRVEGRVVRIFRQGRVGEFPPLVEAWVTSPAGDPFCLVFSVENVDRSLEIGTPVSFSGTFLRQVKYQGGDTARVAPLIVGTEPPSNLVSGSDPGGWSWSSIDWVMGLGAAAVVVLFLARRHFERPVSRPIIAEPHPVFIDGESVPEEEATSDETAR